LNSKGFCGACFFLLFSILVKKGQIVAVRRCLYYKLLYICIAKMKNNN